MHNDETLTTAQALEKSIKHWEENLQAALDNEPDSVHVGAAACALCNKFAGQEKRYDDKCVGCPIYTKTGEKHCAGTPYRWVVYHQDRALERIDGSEDDLVKACKEELDFLKSLREEQ